MSVAWFVEEKKPGSDTWVRRYGAEQTRAKARAAIEAWKWQDYRGFKFRVAKYVRVERRGRGAEDEPSVLCGGCALAQKARGDRLAALLREAVEVADRIDALLTEEAPDA